MLSHHALRWVSRGGCAIPACIACGIPACLAAGLRGRVPGLGGACSGGACSRGVPAPRVEGACSQGGKGCGLLLWPSGVDF